MPESDAHRHLKAKAKEFLKQEHDFTSDQIETEYLVEEGEHRYLVDVVGLSDSKTVAVECGKIRGPSEHRQKKESFLESHFDEYEHFSYLKTGRKPSQEYVSTETELGRILNKYGLGHLTRRQLADYIMALHLNQKDMADEVGVSRRTINQKINKAFQKMNQYERATVIAILSAERKQEAWPEHAEHAEH